MLRLEKMELRGFKSFSDSTQVRFQPGITAIVGPNGCGKSNIGDAINWVLGEQSAKMLRGQQMSDVIFAGSEGRKPLGLAEVSLIFGGAEAIPKHDQGRLTITRRLFRSGESEYLLNGVRALLRDIQEILRESKVGARTYATIEQGKVDQVLNAKPKDRRALIEDAAGISGYKHKRRLAELKLEATYANLLRVNDIVVEVQRQINSLKRQAAKARRYRRLREELRDKELVRFTEQAWNMDRELQCLTDVESRAKDAEAQTAASTGRLEAGLLDERGLLEKANAEFRSAAERLHQLELEIDRGESVIKSCRDRIQESTARAERQREELRGLSSRREETTRSCRENHQLVEAAASELRRLSDNLAEVQANLETAEKAQRTMREEAETLRRRQFESMSRNAELRNQRKSTEEALERNRSQTLRVEAEQAVARQDCERNRSEGDQLTGESDSLKARVTELRGARDELERTLTDARERLAAGVDTLAGAREGERSCQARLSTLEAVETRFAGVSDGVRTLLTSGPATGIRNHGVIADYVEASREVEGAAEGYLHALLPTVILEDDGDAQRAAEMLRTSGAGRTSFVCRTHPAGAFAVGTAGNGHMDLPRELQQDRRVLGRLRDRLQLRTSANGVLTDRIGDAVLVDNLASALELHRRHPSADYLTSDGEVVYASGVIAAGGRQAADEGMLAHKRHIDEARQELVVASTSIATLTAKVENEKTAIDRLEGRLGHHKRELDEAERRALELQLMVERSEEETQRSARRSEVLADELATLKDDSEALRNALEQIVGKQQAAEDEHRELERALAACMESIAGNEEELKRKAETVSNLRAELAALRQRHEAVENEGRRLAGEAAELESRVTALDNEAAAAEAAANENRERAARTESELVRQLEQQRTLAAGIERKERDLAERQERLGHLDTELRKLRADLESFREAARQAELDRTKAEAARRHLDDLCQQELGVSASEAFERMSEQERDADRGQVDVERLEAEIEEIKAKIERVGPVNMTAIEEFTELEERHEFLSSQREDLEQSMESLKDSIRRINRQSRQKFTDAFEAIRQSYQEVYKLLFTGGRADLRLEEGEDVLESGIEILAQPPGKRLTGVHLLSGGEKALSAIALLFAIFRYQPSPFCLLDEVDAPLDDSNVARFMKMVLEYAKHTQFIIITHNKLSMEVADVLYGVTMEEPGVSRVVSLQMQ